MPQVFGVARRRVQGAHHEPGQRSRRRERSRNRPSTTAAEVTVKNTADATTGWRHTRTWRWGRWVLAAGATAVVAAVVAIAALYAGVQLPDEPPQLNSSKVLAADGTELAVFAKDERRIAVDLEEISDVTVDALIAARLHLNHVGVLQRRLVELHAASPWGFRTVSRLPFTAPDPISFSSVTRRMAKDFR